MDRSLKEGVGGVPEDGVSPSCHLGWYTPTTLSLGVLQQQDVTIIAPPTILPTITAIAPCAPPTNCTHASMPALAWDVGVWCGREARRPIRTSCRVRDTAERSPSTRYPAKE